MSRLAISRRNTLLVAVLPVVAVALAFWFVIYSPKRDRAGELAAQAQALRQEVQTLETRASEADSARRRYRSHYSTVVRLGKAVPADADTASLLLQLSRLSDRAGAELVSIELDSADQGAAPAAAQAQQAQQQGGEQQAEDQQEGEGEEQEGEGQEAGAPPPAQPTEAAVATLPLGATVGAGGFPVMPYSLEVQGGFFDIAALIRQLDRQVRLRDGRVRSTGRLMTIDGFSLSQQDGGGLTGRLAVTTFLVDPQEGATAGASPEGPEGTSEPVAAPPAGGGDAS